MQRALAGGLWGSRSLLSSGVLKHGNVSVSNVRAQSAGGVVCRGFSTHEGEDKDAKASATSAAERQAYRDDMATSYGAAYSSRSAEEGFGERYGEAVKAVLEKKEEKMEMQEGTTANRNQTLDAVVVEEYDTTQGEPVAQKEVARHSEHHTAFESEKTAH